MDISEKKIYNEIIISKALGELTSQAKRIFETLVRDWINKINISNEDDKNDCFFWGIQNLYKYWYLFDENKSERVLIFLRHIFLRIFITDRPNPRFRQVEFDLSNHPLTL